MPKSKIRNPKEISNFKFQIGIAEIRYCHRPGFTLLEMLTTVAAFVIVLGLMVDLARHVRNASAIDLTKSLLRRLDGVMAEYEARYHQLPQVTPFIDPNTTDPQEPVLQRTALTNNRQALAALRLGVGESPDAFNGLGTSIYDAAALRDAWGTPIVFMSAMNPAIGMAPQNRRFFFSAGPDRRFLSQEDNLYSYEEPGPAGKSGPAGKPETRNPN